MAYDAQSDRMILFGGLANPSWGVWTQSNQTWAYDFDSNTWTNMSPSVSPSVGAGVAIAYDAHADRVVLFGGFVSSYSDPSDKTWVYDFDSNTWTWMDPRVHPYCRMRHSMVYDAKSDLVILYGGYDSNWDTWAYDCENNTWLDLDPYNRPSPRCDHAMAYDVQSDRVILFGGGPGYYGEYRDETWVFMAPTIPSAPAGLRASAGNVEAVLVWEPPSSDGGLRVTGYRVYRSTSSESQSLLTEVGNVYTYTDVGVSNGVTYNYRVSALNAFGEGPQCEEVQVTPATVPSAPRNLLADPSAGQITLTWEAPSSDGGLSVTNYNVYRGLSSSGESILIELGTVFSYVDTEVTNGVPYYYQVSAESSFGEGPRSSEVSSVPATVPGPPASLMAAPSGDGQVLLSWSPPTSDGGHLIAGYRVYRGVSSGGESLLVELGDVLAHADTGLTNGVTYYYQVSAVNAVGEGSLCDEVQVIPATVPSAPRNLVMTASGGQVTLAWEAPSSDGGQPAISFRVYRGTSSAAESLLIELGIVLTYTDTGVTNGVTYYYQISCANVIGEGAWSDEASGTPVAKPSAPASLQATPGDGIVTLTWQAPSSDGGSEVSGYKLYRGTSPSTESFLVQLGPVPAYTDTVLTNGVTYYYLVTALNAAGESGNSTEVSAMPAPPLSVQIGADPSTGRVPLEVSFTGLVAGGAAPYSYLWYFDDGSASVLLNPTHIYESTGSYHVVLTVTDALGNSTTKSIVIEVTTGGGISWLPTALGGIIAAIAVASILALLLMRRKA